MIKTRSLKARLFILTAAIALTPVVALAIVYIVQTGKFQTIAEKKCVELAYSDLDHLVHNIYAACKLQGDAVDNALNDGLNVASYLVQKEHGGVSLSSDKFVEWDAVNQFTGASSRLKLPEFLLGNKGIGRNALPGVPTPVVDEARQMVGGACTIFQRANEAGDMLRVATNVIKDGKRAIGTYIPATMPDNSPDPVVAALMRGERYEGLAFVVDAYYMTVYAPLFDASHNLVGALFFGVKQETSPELRKMIMAARIGATGYVYVLNSKGAYIISDQGKADGKSIIDVQDAHGGFPARDMIAKAKQATQGEMFEHRYWWSVDKQPAREKIAKLVYFKKWDWIIGAGAYVDEVEQAKVQLVAAGRVGLFWFLGLSGVTLIAAVGIGLLFGGAISRRINDIVHSLTGASDQVSAAAAQISQASQALASGASEQAASLEETTASLEEINSVTKQNAESMLRADKMAMVAKAGADSGVASMRRMSDAISKIKDSSDKTANIIKTINEIAFQTNLLALNAAVEAARVGDAGKGFAVVAEEVRNLAKRSAEAASNTAALIKRSQADSEEGVNVASQVEKALQDINDTNQQVSGLVNQVAAASSEQAKGVDEISKATAEMDKVTQQNASSSEEVASSSEELSAQAAEMNEMVNRLRLLVTGG